MPKHPASPFRILAKTYANEIITREQYVKIRSQLLKKLQSKGKISESDLQNFATITHETDPPKTEKSYSSSDWVIIVLGLTASVVLGLVLYG